MKYLKSHFNQEYYKLWDMGLLIPEPPKKLSSIYSIKFRITKNDEYSRVTLKARSASDALERACYSATTTSPWRPEDVDLHAVYDEEENLLWIDEPFYNLVQKKHEFRGMERREFLKRFGATSAAILYGLQPSVAHGIIPFGFIRPTVIPKGEQVYTSPGTFTWTAPAGVRTVSVVVIGSGGNNAGGGGGLTWSNGLSVTSGASYTVVVGQGGYSGRSSSFNDTACKADGGGSGGAGGGGTGGQASQALGASSYGGGSGGGWGGGAGGYSGNGGVGYGNGNTTNPGTAGSGGAGGGGGNQAYPNNGGGGGTGIFGQGGNGAYPGGGGSGGGTSGSGGTSSVSGAYGGGGVYGSGNAGANGAVRIIWGAGRSFPSNAT